MRRPHRSSFRAFTLIELLVVIAIIGLLASIVMASLSSARTKAALAAGRQFASTLDNSLGAQAVGWWDMSECTGSVAADKSGYGNTAALVASPSWSTNAPLGQGCSVLLDGATQYLDAGNPASLQFAPGSSFTISAWIYMTRSANAVIVSHGDNSFNLYIQGGNQYLFLAKARVANTGVNYAIPLNTWTHIALVNTIGSTAAFYVNGTLLASNSFPYSYVYTQNLRIGESDTEGYYFPGYIGSTRIYASALTASEIHALYAAEAPRYRVAER